MTDYPIVIVPLSGEEGGGFLGFVPDLYGCLSDGETEEEALANVKLAIHEWIDVQQKRGIEVPKPGTAAHRSAEREKKLSDAIKALADDRDSADNRIRDLERKLSELIALLKDESGRSSYDFALPEKPELSKLKKAH